MAIIQPTDYEIIFSGAVSADDQTAIEVPYSNTYSNLVATNVQTALDEVSESLYIHEHSTAIDYLILPKIDLVKVNHAAPVTITLPASPLQFKKYTIKDVSGNAITNNIIVDGNGRIIDNSATFPITANYASFDFIYDSSLDKWNLI